MSICRSAARKFRAAAERRFLAEANAHYGNLADKIEAEWLSAKAWKSSNPKKSRRKSL